MATVLNLWDMWMVGAGALLVVLALQHLWVLFRTAQGARDRRAASRIYGDPDELKMMLYPLIGLSLLIAWFWPLGVFAVVVTVTEGVLRYQHAGQSSREPPRLPETPTAGLSLIRVMVWFSWGAVLAYPPLDAMLEGETMRLFTYGLLPLAGLVAGAAQVLSERPPRMPHVLALTYAAWGGEVEARQSKSAPRVTRVARRAVDDREVAAEAASAVVAVAPEPADATGPAVDDARILAAREAARKLAMGAVAADLRWIREEEEEQRAREAERVAEEAARRAEAEAEEAARRAEAEEAERAAEVAEAAVRHRTAERAATEVAVESERTAPELEETVTSEAVAEAEAEDAGTAVQVPADSDMELEGSTDAGAATVDAEVLAPPGEDGVALDAAEKPSEDPAGPAAAGDVAESPANESASDPAEDP